MTPNVHLDDLSAQQYLDGDLAGAGRADAAAHLAGCPDCRLLVDSYRALTTALDDLEVLSPPVDFTAGVLRRIEQRERFAARERWLATAILAVVVAVGAGLLATTGAATMAPALSRLGDVVSSAATGLRVVFDVAEPILKALRLQIAVATAGAALPLLVALRRLAPRRSESLA